MSRTDRPATFRLPSCSTTLNFRTMLGRRLTGSIAMVILAGSVVALTPVARANDAPAKVGAGLADPMPITGITLYRSGVGSFLRSGVVEGNGKIALKFDVAQINDVLKTLQVLDLDKGRIDSVTYASKEPLARRLGSFSVNLADNPSMSALLERLRGSPVKLATFADGTITGTVLSVESRKMPGNDKSPAIDTAVVNVITATGIRSVAIPTISSFSIEDPKLADEMSRALQAIAESRAERVKSVDLALTGEGKRRVAAAYVHETPVWKTSYRLILPDAVEPGKPDPANIGPVLKGWALVENTTDSDWTNVKLALVSGRPVSFSMDLSEPMYVFRPEVPVPTVAGVMPRQYEGGMKPTSTDAIVGGVRVSSGAAQSMMNSSMRMEAGAPGSPGGGGRPRSAAFGTLGMDKAGAADGAPPAPITGLSPAEMTDYGMVNRAKGMEVGEQFQFEVATPVTIERQRSAMIPIIDANLTGRRVSIYNQADRADHPLRGVELTNSSGLQLLPGPLAVYDGAAYAGDAQIGQVSIGDKRLLAYALDTDVAVQTDPVNESNITKVKIAGGMFERTYKVRSGTKYTFDNRDLKRARNLMVEHPKLSGWSLAEGGKPEESTQSVYRFALELGAGKKQTLSVVQEQISRSDIGVMDWNEPELVVLQKQGAVSAAVLEAFREAGRKNQAVQRLENKLSEQGSRIETSKKDQSQLTDMLSRLDRQNANYQSISDRLGVSLKLLEKLEGEQAELRRQLETARSERDTFMQNLNVE